ncbi:MAG: hypothetical protein CSA84_01770 [Actinomycetales bacterium]|nr:MAG: hypothetical protein CSA84_01770 [Actinomycetales bacterium]
MTFNDNVRLDTSQVEAGRRGRAMGRGTRPGRIQVGGGIGGLILLVIVLIFGGGSLGQNDQLPDLGTGGQGSPLDPSQVGVAGTQTDAAFAECKTGSDANRSDECLIIATVNTVQDYWATTLHRYGKQYPPAKTVIYSGTTESGCGTASNQVGPFYCPLDEKVYIDASFFDELSRRFGADGGQLAKEYVIAHEYGHHIQNVLGLLGRAQQDPQGPQSGAVRIELMADCLAGTWVKHATETTDANGTPFLQAITPEDIDSALSAAAAVGDDRIQKAAQGRVTPESWTHGSAAARQQWFLDGYQSGDMNKCNTFAVDRVE